MYIYIYWNIHLKQFVHFFLLLSFHQSSLHSKPTGGSIVPISQKTWIDQKIHNLDEHHDQDEMHGKSATLARCEERNTWKIKLPTNEHPWIPGSYFGWVHRSSSSPKLQESQSSSPRKRTSLFSLLTWMVNQMDMLLMSVVCVCVVVMARKRHWNEWTSMTDFIPISCFGFNWDTHPCKQNKQYKTIKNWLYIATTLLSNIAMRTHLSKKKYVICMDVWAVGHPQTPSRGSEKTWPWSSVIPLPRVAHVVSNPSHQAPAKKWTNKNQTQVEIVRGWGELQL